MFPYIFDPTAQHLTVVIDNKQHSINKETHPNFEKVIDAIRAGDEDTVRDLVDVSAAVANYSYGFLEVKDGDVYWDGKPFHNAMVVRLLEMMKQGFPVEPIVEFMHNLKKNPSKRAVDELYGFLECNSLPITSDGHFLAYKKVQNDYKDIYTGTMDNSVGKVVEMVRNEVDEDKERTCSTGLHFCSLEYLPSFGYGSGNRVVIVKINPRDVVSIPTDYNNAKGRCCRYEVIGEHTVEDGINRDETEAFDAPVYDYGNLEVEFDFDDLDDEVDSPENEEPRAVFAERDFQGNVVSYRFADNGRFASYADYRDYQDWKVDDDNGLNW